MMKFNSYQQVKTDFYFGIVKKFFAYHPKNTGSKKCTYITFDDGPEPEITEFVLEQLAHYNAKATFFCCGHNITSHPNLYNRLISEGHAVGNHTYSHLYGLSTKPQEYVNDVRRCDEMLPKDTILFRPPWGIINFREMLLLWKKRVVLWDVESGDVRTDCNLNDILASIDAHVEKGNGIILFHFSKEHEQRTRKLLPPILKHCAAAGYLFNTL